MVRQNYTVYEDEGLLEIVIEVESGKMAFTDIFLQIEDMRNTAGESRTTTEVNNHCSMPLLLIIIICNNFWYSTTQALCKHYIYRCTSNS